MDKNLNDRIIQLVCVIPINLWSKKDTPTNRLEIYELDYKELHIELRPRQDNTPPELFINDIGFSNSELLGPLSSNVIEHITLLKTNQIKHEKAKTILSKLMS